MKPVQDTYLETARTLQKMLRSEDAKDVAKKLRRPVSWIEDMLSLLKLHHLAKALVDDGGIPLGIAYELAKMNLLQQLYFLQKAKTLTIAQFKEQVNAVPEMWE